MNDITMTGLKIIVERVVRPVRASISCKRVMREELLSHVSGVFGEELSKHHDEQTALERTSLRFGNAIELTNQLQNSVPASNLISRFWKGRPEDSMLRIALRFVFVLAAVGLTILGAAVLALGWDRPWSLQELMALCSNLVFWFPVFLGLTLIIWLMQKSLYEASHLTATPRTGWTKPFVSAWGAAGVRRVIIVGGLGQFMVLMAVYVAANGLARSWSRDHLFSILETVPAMAFKALLCVVAAPVIAWPAVERRLYQEEWSSLPIEPSC